MKKTCDRCKALIEAQGELLKCYLKFKIDGQKGIPLEECPKPLNYTDLIYQNAKKNFKGEENHANM